MNKLQVEIAKAKKQILKVVKKKHPNTDNISISFEDNRNLGITTVVHPWEGYKLPNSYYPPTGLTVNQVKNYIRHNDPFVG